MRHDWSWKAGTKCFAVGLLVLGLTIGLAPVVGAASIPITATDGTWQGAVPDANATIDNTGIPRTARWGTIGGSQSGYDWTPATPFDADSGGTPFSLGTFSHLNFPIPVGTSITGIDLNFSMTIDGLAPLGGLFNFAHNETTNPAPDEVTISSPFLNTPFNYLGTNYFFSMLGFSQDGGATIDTQFVTEENLTNTANLYGVITERPIGGEVPEPASLLLLGGGLVGLYRFRKKFRK